MSRIEKVFERLTPEKRKALVIFLTVGDPSLSATADLVKSATEAGADIIELGVPFSDPVADGPVIQESFHRSIARGTTLTNSLKTVEKIRSTCDVPLVFMLASTLVINRGADKFMKDSANAGIDGIIIPDAPADEADEFIPPARAVGLDTIFLVAPTSDPARVKKIVKLSRGFLYYINVQGVTGVRTAAPKDSGKAIADIKKLTKTPVLAGFGIKTPAQAKAFGAVADGVIIGSRAIEITSCAPSRQAAVKELGRFVRSVRKAMDGRG